MKKAACVTILLSALAAVFVLAGGRDDSPETYGTKKPDVEPPMPSRDWVRLGKPKPGEWLNVFEEKGETFAEYRFSVTNRKTQKRDVLYIVPLGKIKKKHPKLLRDSAEYIEIFFDSKVKVLKPRPLPESAYNKERGQYNAATLMKRVMLPIARQKDDALAVAGFAQRDLYSEPLNFVFGIGSLSNRTGLYAVHRLIAKGEKDPKKAYDITLRRTVKLACHELGHIFSMRHCTFYECLMNGSNSLAESDSRPQFLCPVCLRKLEWNFAFDRLRRYQRLKKFYKKHGWKEEEAFCRRRISELKQLKKRND